MCSGHCVEMCVAAEDSSDDYMTVQMLLSSGVKTFYFCWKIGSVFCGRAWEGLTFSHFRFIGYFSLLLSDLF